MSNSESGVMMISLDNIRRVWGFSTLTDQTLQWLVDQSQEVWIEPGVVFRREGDPAEHVFILLEGDYWITQRVGAEEVLLKAVTAYELFGEVPILMGVDYFWASGHARTRCQILEIPNEVFWTLMGICSSLATTIVRTATARLQEVQLIAQHRENLMSLGNMAAGLAHELNNPAAASRQAARQLREVFPVLQALALEMTRKSIQANQEGILEVVRQEAIARAYQGPPLDPLTQSDREDEVTDWLTAHGIANAWNLAPTLVGVGLDTQWLNQLASQLSGQCTTSVITWLEMFLTGAGLLDQLHHSTQRIFNIVDAVQGLSEQDSSTFQSIDIHESLESTLTILQHKLKQGVTVIRDYGEHVPPFYAYGTEISQVWINLIDNAIDAAMERFVTTQTEPITASKSQATLTIPNPWQNLGINQELEQGRSPHLLMTRDQQDSPTIWIQTRHHDHHLIVEIADNGVGIPPEIQSRIFEPFFTTKGVGQGTGIGLQIVRRIVDRYQGHIDISSKPGNTCFQVNFPVYSNRRGD
jgi:signal transduction histidine kinase